MKAVRIRTQSSFQASCSLLRVCSLPLQPDRLEEKMPPHGSWEGVEASFPAPYLAWSTPMPTTIYELIFSLSILPLTQRRAGLMPQGLAFSRLRRKCLWGRLEPGSLPRRRGSPWRSPEARHRRLPSLGPDGPAGVIPAHSGFSN